MKKLLTTIILFLLSFSVTSQVVYRTIKIGKRTTVVYIGTLPTTTGSFSFTIVGTKKVSAHVYKNDSVLVATLFVNQSFIAGTYSSKWDGKDDKGVALIAPESSYKIKVTSNALVYTWQGTLGNNSDSMIGQNKHKGYYDCMVGLAFSSLFGYYCTGYPEGLPSIAKFAVGSPRVKIPIGMDKESNANTDFTATDGTRVYWGGYDPNSNINTYVYAHNCSDDSRVTFSSGVNYKNVTGRTYSTAGRATFANSYITGLAVQQSGNFLIIARGALNKIYVVNKTTGAHVDSSSSLTNPRGISIDNSDNLWVVSGTNTVARYTVNGDGTLSAATLTLAGLTDPLSVNQGNGLVAVCENATEQVKFYNSTTGAATTTLGTSGGYKTNSTVTDYKLYFNDILSGAEKTFVAFQTDGTYWVNDPGNYRVQHYNTSNVFTDRVMSIGASYNIDADKKDSSRIFVIMGQNLRCLEFRMDYAVQTLTGSAGWTFVKNWGTGSTTGKYKFPKYNTIGIITLSNGKTYGIIDTIGKKVAVEFGTDTIRPAGIGFSNALRFMCDDGSLQGFTSVSNVYTYTRYPLTGFSGSNPTWSAVPDTIARASRNLPAGSPANIANRQMLSSNNKVVLFDPNTYTDGVSLLGTGPHLGLMQRGSNDMWQWQSEFPNRRFYEALYPEPGTYEVGNQVNNNSGGTVNIVGDIIITNYHGEFWRAAQTNWFNVYNDKGAVLGKFGSDESQKPVDYIPSVGMAGNNLDPIAIKVGSDIYIYHGDESYHAAAHRFKISGLSTISEQVINVLYPSTYSPDPVNYVNLMAGLPIADTLTNGDGGWSMNPTTPNLTNQYTDFFLPLTSKQTYKLGENDIYVRSAVANPGNNTVSKNFTANATTSWKITGQISYPVGTNLNGTRSQQFVEVLDTAGKALVRFYVTTNSIYGNTGAIGSFSSSYKVAFPTDFIFECTSAGVNFTYGNYAPITVAIMDGTATWNTPSKIQIRQTNNGLSGSVNNQISALSNLKFYIDY